MSTPPTETLPPALERLIADRSWLLGLARRLVRDDSRAEDLTQDTLMAAARRPPGPEVVNLRAWAAKVLTNRHRDVARSEGRRSRREEEACRPEREPSTAELFAEASSQATITRAVTGLDEDEREIVMRVFYQGLSVSEAARRLGLPRSTVQSRLDRSLASLRRDLDGEHGSRGAWVGMFAPWLALYPEPVAAPGPGLPASAGAGLKVAAGVTLALGAGLGALAWFDREPSELAGADLAAAPEVALEADVIEAPRAPVELERAALVAPDGVLIDGPETRPLGPRVPLVVRLRTESGEPVASGSLTLGDGRGRRYMKRFIDIPEVVFEHVAPGPAQIRAFINGVTAVEHSFVIQGEAPVVDVFVAPSAVAEVALAGTPLGPVPAGLQVLISDAPRLELDSDWWLDWRNAAVFGTFLRELPEEQRALAPGHIGWVRFHPGRATHAHLVLGDRWLATEPLPSAGGVMRFDLSEEDLTDQLSTVSVRLMRGGLPVPGQEIELVQDGHPTTAARSDDAGHLTVEGVAAGRTLLRTTGEGPAQLRFLELEPGSELDLGDWPLEGRVLRGSLRGPGGNPSHGSVDVRLAAWDMNAPRLHFPADANGDFELALPDEDCWLQGRGSRGALSGPAVFVPADQTEFEDFTLGFVRMVQLAVTLPLDLPDTAVVRVMREDDPESSWLELVGGRGILDLLLDPDHYTLQLLSAPDGGLLSSTEGWFGPTANSTSLIGG